VAGLTPRYAQVIIHTRAPTG